MSTALIEDVALFDITLDGQPVKEEVLSRLTEIRVLNYLALPDLCTFDCGFAFDDFDDQPFEVGAAIEVKLGSAQANSTTTLFKGEIVTLEPTFSGGTVTLRVRALDKAHRLQRTRKIRTWTKMSVADVARKVLQEAGLSPKIDSGLSMQLEHCQQDNETDWDFLWRLARRFGAELFVDGDTATMARPSSASPITLTWGENLRDFKAQVTAIQQPREVTINGWDVANAQTLSSSESSPDQVSKIGIERSKVANTFPATTHIATEEIGGKEEGDALAAAMLSQLANGYVAGEGTCAGNPRIRAGATLQISGVGRQFSGTYRVQATTHTVQGGGTYQTHFHNAPVQTIRGALGAAAQHVARDFGAQLTVGIVSNNADDQKLGRVKVKFPHFNDTDESAWARVALPGAGRQRGQTMIPQVNDEVLVAFFHGNTRFPVVLGSLHNGKNDPGDELLSDNDGSWVLRSDKRIDMKATEAILVEGKDMTFTAHGDLTLSTDQAASATSADTFTVKSDRGKVVVEASAGAIELKGMQVEVNAQTTLKLSGQMVQISGSQIMLG